MPFLINPLNAQSIGEAVDTLEEVHRFLVSSAREWGQIAEPNEPIWGIKTKRKHIDFGPGERPALVGKNAEAFSEVVNIVSTVERLISALRWFANGYPRLELAECHPSTSDAPESNDIVLRNLSGTHPERILCEVSDVAAISPSRRHNGKERSDLKKLGCITPEGNVFVPNDNVSRFIATSRGFADALRRPIETHSYEYHETGDSTDTILLKIQPG